MKLFNLQLEGCNFVDYKVKSEHKSGTTVTQTVDHNSLSHPMLQSTMITVKHISLVK